MSQFNPAKPTDFCPGLTPHWAYGERRFTVAQSLPYEVIDAVCLYELLPRGCACPRIGILLRFNSVRMVDLAGLSLLPDRHQI